MTVFCCTLVVISYLKYLFKKYKMKYFTSIKYVVLYVLFVCLCRGLVEEQSGIRPERGEAVNSYIYCPSAWLLGRSHVSHKHRLHSFISGHFSIFQFCLDDSAFFDPFIRPLMERGARWANIQVLCGRLSY